MPAPGRNSQVDLDRFSFRKTKGWLVRGNEQRYDERQRENSRERYMFHNLPFLALLAIFKFLLATGLASLEA